MNKKSTKKEFDLISEKAFSVLLECKEQVYKNLNELMKLKKTGKPIDKKIELAIDELEKDLDALNHIEKEFIDKRNSLQLELNKLIING